MLQAPCKDCTKRELYCHGRCEEYIAYKEQRNAELEEEHRRKEEAYQRVMYIRSSKKRMMKGDK